MAVAVAVAIRAGRPGGTEIMQETEAMELLGHLEAAADPGEPVPEEAETGPVPTDMEVVVVVVAVHMVRRAVPAALAAMALPVSS